MSATNVTISGNKARDFGGGINNGGNGTLTLTNMTISDNTGLANGGIYNDGQVKLDNTIVAENLPQSSPQCGGNSLVSSLGHNLDSDGTCNLTGTGDIPNGNANLGPLTLNAPGTTETHALLAGSDAIDAGNPATPGSGGTACEDTDQRGVNRPQGAACDIGAYEFEPPMEVKFLLIDEDTMDNGIGSIENISFNPPNCGAGDPAVCVNDDTANPGVRTLLFTRGTDITPFSGLELPTGQVADEGLFRFTNPDPQVSLQNGATFTTAEFIAATGDAADENNLDKIDGVVPLSDAEIVELEGKTVCAVVYDSDISTDPGDASKPPYASLKGSTLGLTAFKITSVSPNPAGDSYLPLITVDLVPSGEVQTICERDAQGIARIAFVSQRDDKEEIYVMDAIDADGDGNGDNLVQLTNNSLTDAQPAWSPDGNLIAFHSAAPGSSSLLEIYFMDAVDANGDGNGDNIVRLTDNGAFDCCPRWSPDRGSLVFFSNRDSNNEIYVMTITGDNPTNLTNNSGQDEDPDWSPDGLEITFRSERDGDAEIYVMSLTGDRQTNLTNNPGSDDYEPSWSPDGSQIVFISDRDGNTEVYVMDADGSNLTRLTNNPSPDDSPAWSRDGTKIAFGSGAIRDIYVMDAVDANGDGNGDNLTRLTNNPAAGDSSPDWSPGIAPP